MKQLRVTVTFEFDITIRDEKKFEDVVIPEIIEGLVEWGIETKAAMTEGEVDPEVLVHTMSIDDIRER